MRGGGGSLEPWSSDIFAVEAFSTWSQGTPKGFKGCVAKMYRTPAL